jgi:hypothetical protein
MIGKVNQLAFLSRLPAKLSSTSRDRCEMRFRGSSSKKNFKISNSPSSQSMESRTNEPCSPDFRLFTKLTGGP